MLDTVVTCFINVSYLQSGQWSTFVEDKNSNLFIYYCPPGYCRCFLNTSVGSSSCVNVYVNSDPDRQCVCGRKVRCIVYIIDYEYLIGILCGECGNGKGVSALLNNCVTCSNNNIVLIPLLGTVQQYMYTYHVVYISQ